MDTVHRRPRHFTDHLPRISHAEQIDLEAARIMHGENVMSSDIRVENDTLIAEIDGQEYSGVLNNEGELVWSDDSHDTVWRRPSEVCCPVARDYRMYCTLGGFEVLSS